MKEVNRQIIRCGLYYLGHYGITTIKVYGEDFNFEIPLKRVRNFTDIFPEVNWENGEFLETLGGKYIRLVLSDNDNIIGLRHIVKDLTYWKDDHQEVAI